MIMVPDPSIRLQQWLFPGWVEAMPTYLPVPVIRLGFWLLYMGGYGSGSAYSGHSFFILRAYSHRP